jgi:hypothetical protein
MEVAKWTSYAPPPFDRYALLGLPEEESEQLECIGDRGQPQTGISVTLNLLGVEPIDTRSDVPRFAGILQDGRHLASVVGMSGGPILGISEVGDSVKYQCVAVQGSWIKGSRTIYGTPVSIVVDAVLKMFES